MSSTVLLNLLRRGHARRAVARRVRPPQEAAARCDQVGGASLARRQASGPGSFVGVRPVTWDSFGIWDDPIEEPVLLPSSIRYGRPDPQVGLDRVGSASVRGLREQNEDRLRVARIHDDLLYFAVFDGHGGPHAADYCYTFMEKFIRDALEDDDDLEKVLKRAFLDADRALHTHLRYFNDDSFLTAGTTATVAMLRGGAELVVGSVGDSRALLCREGRVHKLSRDHTPEREDERRRIQSCGGFVTWNSAGHAYVNGRLAMTRSIGDFHLKSCGVIVEPDTQRVNIRHADDSFLALTTDGVNFLLSDQEVCDVIKCCPDPTEAAEVVAQQALQYGSEDNATAVVVPFGAWGKYRHASADYSLSRSFCSSGRWA
ncbi:unnamed protein product [Ophioblennius macclurei]